MKKCCGCNPKKIKRICEACGKLYKECRCKKGKEKTFKKNS